MPTKIPSRRLCASLRHPLQHCMWLMPVFQRSPLRDTGEFRPMSCSIIRRAAMRYDSGFRGTQSRAITPSIRLTQSSHRTSLMKRLRSFHVHVHFLSGSVPVLHRLLDYPLYPTSPTNRLSCRSLSKFNSCLLTSSLFTTPLNYS